MNRWISGIVIPKVIVYENFKLGLVQVLLSCLALVFWLWFVVWEMNYVEVAQPFGAVTFSTGAASYAVDTASYDYCSTSSVDGCTVLQPSEALMGRGTSPGNLFVNTKVDLSYETCAAASCSASTAIGWVAPYASVAATKDMYTATKTASYLVAGVEDYSVTINHAASSPWGDKQRSADGRAGSSWGMTGVLLGPNGWSAEPLMKFEKGAYDVLPVSTLLEAAGLDLCETAESCDAETDPRLSGATLLVELQYNNLVSWSDWASKIAYADTLSYAYKVSRIDSAQGDGIGAATVTDVHPDLSGGKPLGQSRITVERSGITVAFQVAGTVGKFSFYRFWVACVVGAGAFGLAALLFTGAARGLVCDSNLRHKLATARAASSELFVYSASAHKLKDGTFANVNVEAKAVLKPELELSEYQKRKGIQRKFSRTKLDEGLYGGNGGGNPNGGGGWDDDDEENGGGFSPVHSGGSHKKGGGGETRKPVPIGTKIKREFPGYGFFDGTVVEYKKPYYRVVYPDGDSEQLLGRELRPLVMASQL